MPLPLYRFLIFGLVLVSTVAANATTLRVDVRMPNGDRAGEGVTVTVGENGVITSGSPKAVTDRQSRVQFDNIDEGQVLIVVTQYEARGEWRGTISGKRQNVKVTLEYGMVGTPAVAPTEEGAEAVAGEGLSATPEEQVAGEAMPDQVQPIPDPAQVVMQINQDAECTARDQVYLTINVSGPEPSHYRVSENSPFSGEPWYTYPRDPPNPFNPAFTLSPGGGIKRVYFQVRSPIDGGYLESNVANDYIERVVSNARATLAINAGADTTYSRSVTLNNTATFDGGGTNPKYIASESSEFVGAQWQSYSTAPQFTLSEALGTKTVYFRSSREVCGTLVATTLASDTINLGEGVVSEVATGTAPAPVSTEPVATPTKPFYFEYGGSDSSDWRSPTVATVGALAKEANQYGFTHSAQKIAGEGTCAIAFDEVNMVEKPVLFMIATPVVEKVDGVLVHSLICEFNMFAGRKLNSGWGIETFGVPDDIKHPMGTTGKWVGNSSLVSHENFLNHVIRINVPAYQCGFGSPDLFCPTCDGLRPTGFSCWSLGAYYPNFDILGPESATDWRDAVRQ